MSKYILVLSLLISSLLQAETAPKELLNEATTERTLLSGLYSEKSTAIETLVVDINQVFDELGMRFTPALTRYVEEEKTLYFSKLSNRSDRCRGQGLWSLGLNKEGLASQPKALLDESYCIVGLEPSRGQLIVSLWDTDKGRQVWVPGAGNPLSLSGLFSRKNAFSRWQLDLWHDLPQRPFSLSESQVYAILESNIGSAQILVSSQATKQIQKVTFKTQDDVKKDQTPGLPEYSPFSQEESLAIFSPLSLVKENPLGLFIVSPSDEEQVSSLWYWSKSSGEYAKESFSFGSQRAYKGNQFPKHLGPLQWSPRNVPDWAITPTGVLLIDSSKRFGEWQLAAHFSPVLMQEEESAAFSFIENFPVKGVTGVQYFKKGLILTKENGEIIFRGPEGVFTQTKGISFSVPLRGGINRKEFEAKQKAGE